MRLIGKISPKKLKELYWHRKMSSSEIAKIYHCNPSYIRDLLKKYSIRIRTASEARRILFNINIPKKELRKLYLEKKFSSLKIAEIYKCGHVTIRQRLRKYGIRVRILSEANRARFNINIPKKELKKLYLERKISSIEIAKIYYCSPGTIRRLLRKYGIKIRTKSEAKKLFYNINISKKELRTLYLKRKLSCPKIAKIFNCSSFLIRNKLKEHGIPSRSVKEALCLSNQPRYLRKDFSGDLEEKAHLIGFGKGDLHINQTSSRTIHVSMHSSKLSQIKLFEGLFSKYGHIWRGNPDKIKAVSVRCFLNNTFEFLVDKKDIIDPWILKNKKYFFAFLAGYTDAEGSFCICRDNGVFNIRSQDKKIIYQIREKLIELEILLRPAQVVRRKGTKDIRGTISNKDIWGIFVYRKNALLKLIDLLNPYLKHADKRRWMKIVKNNIIWRNKKYNRHQASKYDKLYLNEGINYVRT